MSDVFSYALDIQDREFWIHVSADKKIHWDDVKFRRKRRSNEDRYLEIKTMMGDKQARARLGSETDNFTVSVEISDDLFEWLGEMNRRDEERGGKLTAEAKADTREIDRRLTEFFWNEVNEFLNPQLKRPDEPSTGSGKLSPSE